MSLAPAPVEVVRAARRGPTRARRTLVGGLAALLVGVLLIRVLLGDFTVTFPDFVRILRGDQLPGASYIVLEVKLPRALLGALCGLAFGVGGAVFQSSLRNPLASPDIIGVSVGASAAAVFAIVVLGSTGLSVSAVAVAGAVVVALAVRWAARNRRHESAASAYRLVLVGVGVTAALQSVIHYLFTRADVYDAQLALRWLTGSVNAASWPTLRLLAALLVVLLPLVAAVARSLSLVELGSDTASSLGVPARRLDLLMLVAVVLVAVAVAAAGPIAFVAFLAGPVARALNRGATTLLGAGLVGAVVVVGSDFMADYLVPGGNYPVGVVTGAVGAPFLLWLLTRSRTRRSA